MLAHIRAALAVGVLMAFMFAPLRCLKSVAVYANRRRMQTGAEIQTVAECKTVAGCQIVTELYTVAKTFHGSLQVSSPAFSI
jgi:hypothetical protein